MIEMGDCLELMKEVPDRSVDMVLCDLPYGITKNSWDKVIPLQPLWEQYRRITKETAAIVLFSSMPFTAQLVSSNTKDYKYMWTWYKHGVRNFLNAKKQPLRTTENICVFYRKQCTYNPQMRTGLLHRKGNSGRTGRNYGTYGALHVVNDQYYPTDILDFAGVPSSEILHPTQKPVALLEYLIKTYTNEGETVLDNCMGSGSTCVAAINTGRNYIGFEKAPEYFEIAKRRIEEATKK